MVKAHLEGIGETASLRFFVTEGAMLWIKLTLGGVAQLSARLIVMELAERLSVIGFVTETEFKCPLSQFVLADALV